MTLRIRSERVVTPHGVRHADVVIEDGTIAAIETPVGKADRDVGRLALLPGAVDVHVHINEPGRTEWEGFETATRAAVAGGTTTVVDMPLNSIPSTTSTEALHAKIEATDGKLYADVGFWGGVVPGNTGDLEELWRAGVLGFKCFMVDSGVAEFEAVAPADLEEAMPVLARLGAPLLAHAELAEELSQDAWENGDPTSYASWMSSRPDSAEHAAIRVLTEIAKRHGTSVHVVHLATAEALPMLRELRAAMPNLSVETCAHYLTFAAEDIPARATAYKCAPPIRGRATREALWAGLVDGTIDFVTTDHSPGPPALKAFDTGRFDLAWGGIPSIQLLLSALWTGASARGQDLSDLAQWVSSRPAKFARLGNRKGAIAIGLDADLVVFDPEATYTVSRDAMFHRHRYTPYEGMELRGVVEATYLRGAMAYDRTTGFGPPTGRTTLRDDI